MNKVILKGNVVADPESKSVNANGKDTTVASFTVAVNRRFKKANGEYDQQATFIDCEAWDSGAVYLAGKVKKGDPILIEGSIKVDQWTNEAGEKRSRTKVRVTNFDPLFRKPKSDVDAEATSVTADTSADSGADPAGDGDIPF